MSPTGTSRIRSRRRPMPARRSPPVAVRAEMWTRAPGAQEHPEQGEQALDDEDRHGGEHHADAGGSRRAPPPRARRAPTSARAWSMPRPRPSLSDPRIVSGPAEQQDAVSHPSMNRSWPRGPFRPRCSSAGPRTPGSSLRGLEASSIRGTDPAIEPMSRDPRTMSRGKPTPTASRSAGSVAGGRQASRRAGSPDPGRRSPRTGCAPAAGAR